ncbi:MAG: hypothetical protein DI622_18700 [Chryseobacterium sp.]|uniref:hypothetical protein n=1 Tax=Chryseobacterium sp. TaxID=1871047 RepID=UPI000DB74100|nr:hypothetical protein [Chryseobacterium sp.]MPS65811.1 hypothetical protein [Chryseobacterium sp.]PZU05687.1 MAG: hypothetical protein DI622_18700 [Chryseobacterium sp.]
MSKKTKNKKSQSIFSGLITHKLSWLEFVAIGFCLWFLFYPHPYEILLGILLLIPLIGILINGIEKPSLVSLVEITKDERGYKKYDVLDFIDITAWAILIRVLLDYEFESFYSMIIPGTIAFIIVLIILFSTHKLITQSTKNKWWIYSSIIFNVCIYSYAGTYAANCAFDNSKPQKYLVKVVGKRIVEGRRSDSYYIKITPWGNHKEEEISVSKQDFDKLYNDREINIDLKKGLFDIPWYYVEIH